jgi:hypothetical protein
VPVPGVKDTHAAGHLCRVEELLDGVRAQETERLRVRVGAPGPRAALLLVVAGHLSQGRCLLVLDLACDGACDR